MLHLSLTDDQYPFEGVDHVRKVSRGVVLDEAGHIALHVVHRDDIFGNDVYYETPGGGVDEGESFEEALVRECGEELGAEVEILGYLGEVDDYYNLIKRKNINRFYVARILRKGEKHFASSGDNFIEKTIYVSMDEAIDLYEKQITLRVPGLVRQRELPIFYEAKRFLYERNK